MMNSKKQLTVARLFWAISFIFLSCLAISEETNEKYERLMQEVADFQYDLSARTDLLDGYSERINAEKQDQIKESLKRIRQEIEKQADILRRQVKEFHSKKMDYREILKKIQDRKLKTEESIGILEKQVEKSLPPKEKKRKVLHKEMSETYPKLFWALGFYRRAGQPLSRRPISFDLACRFMQAIHTDIVHDRIMHSKIFDDAEVRRFRKMLDTLDAYNLKLELGIRFLPGAKRPYGWSDPQYLQNFKDIVKQIFAICGKHPAFVGFHLDEDHCTPNDSPYSEQDFQRYLKNKYTSKQLKSLGIENVSSVLPPRDENRQKEKVLWMEYQEFLSSTTERVMKELRDYIHSLRDDIYLRYDYTTTTAIKYPFRCSLSRLGKMVDSAAVPYWHHSGYRENDLHNASFQLDLASSAGYPVWNCPIPYQGRGDNKFYQRSLALSFAHAKGLQSFPWRYIWKYPPRAKSLKKFWREGAWDINAWACDRIEKIEPYLVNTESGAKIAALYSERTIALKGGYVNQKNIYQTLSQMHIQEDPIFAEGLRLMQLKPYQLLILSEIASLTKKQIAVLRKWVAEGGIILATSGITKSDRWGRNLKDYALADVLGVSYNGSKKIQDASSFSYQFPASEIVTAPCYALGNYDSVKPTSGKVIGRWNNGEPFLILNKYGSGMSLFLTTTINLGLRSTEERLYREIIQWALKNKGDELPFMVRNCPQDVQVIMRLQNKKRRLIIHFTNFTWKEPIDKIEIEVRIPREKIKVFYPENEEEVNYKRTENGRIKFKVRNFDVHEIVVIEY